MTSRASMSFRKARRLPVPVPDPDETIPTLQGAESLDVGVVGDSPGTPYSQHSDREDQTRLLAYKTVALNHINSNHVNHRIVRGGRRGSGGSQRRSQRHHMSGQAIPSGLAPRASGSGYNPLTHSSYPGEATSPQTIARSHHGTPQSSEPTSRTALLPPVRNSPHNEQDTAQQQQQQHPQHPQQQKVQEQIKQQQLLQQQLQQQQQQQQQQLQQPEHDCKLHGCERVRINVSGQYYETRIGLLNRHPDTLLGNPKKRQRFYDRTRDEFFIDRHRPSFEAVFAYFQYGGKLGRPHNVPDDIFLAELYFYELEKEVVDEYKKGEGYVQEDVVMPKHKVLKQIWMLFEYPETSNAAFAVAVISVIMTLVSIVLFCVETLPVFAVTHCVDGEAPNFLDPFFVIETTCTAWFTIEVIVRFIACPSKLGFWKDFKNIVDLTAIIPYYVTFFNVVSTMSCSSAKSSASLAFLRVIRLIRVFKLTKHSVGLQVLILTFKASIEGLGLFLIALIVCLLIFSSAIYYAEFGIPGSQIHSIPDAFWWAIITMTTVGYGDKVPVGVWGRLIGSICALVGVLTLAIPVPIITGNFNRFYSHKTGRGKHSL